jgi:hypothetical protein
MKKLDMLVEADANGKIVNMHQHAAIKSHMKQRAGTKFQIVIRDETRNNSQNALLWAMYGEIMKAMIEAGKYITTDHLHDFFKKQFIAGDVAYVRNEEVVIRSTKKMTKSKFSDYIEFIRSHDLCLDYCVVFTDRDIEQLKERYGLQ